MVSGLILAWVIESIAVIFGVVGIVFLVKSIKKMKGELRAAMIFISLSIILLSTFAVGSNYYSIQAGGEITGQVISELDEGNLGSPGLLILTAFLMGMIFFALGSRKMFNLTKIVQEKPH